MGAFWNDIKFGLRMLWKAPGYTLLAAAALALGIGANTAIFSVADGFLYEAVSFPHLNRLALIFQTLPQRGITRNNAAPGVFRDWKDESRSFRDLAAYEWYDAVLSTNGLPDQAWGFRVTPNFFQTLGVKPLFGRTFSPDEAVPGRDQEVLLSYRTWKGRYGGDPAILGKTIRINGTSMSVIGVMPRDFVFPLPAQLWLPLAMTGPEQQARDTHPLHVIGLLRHGVSFSQANAELAAIQERLDVRNPSTDKGWGARVVDMRSHLSNAYTRHYLFLLLAAVGFVLLIACANVANLQFARATRRQREFALRTALGSGRWRLIRQLLVESVMLSLVGAAAGLLLASWSIRLILDFMPARQARYIPGWSSIGLDSRAFLFALAIAVVAGLIAGLVPALEGSHPDLNETLKEGGRSGSSGRARRRLRSVFVVAEISLSLVLLVGAGLITKGLRALLGLNQNFHPKSLLTMIVNLPASGYATDAARANFYQQVLRRLGTMPGVRLAAAATNVPDGENEYVGSFSIEDRPARPGERRVSYFQSVSPGFFRALHVPLVEGRLFNAGDGAGAPPVAIVSQALAQRYFPGRDPIGHRVKFGPSNSKNGWATIVGVVGDVKYNWLERQIVPALYEPIEQSPQTESYLMVRTLGEPTSLIPEARRLVAAIAPGLALREAETLDRVISDSMIGLGYVAVMMTILGAIALLLACVGIYGVMSFAVAERTHEIGIRLALGAKRSEVMKLILRHGLTLAGIAFVIGLPLSFGLSRLIASLVFGVSATDPATFIGVSLLLLLVALGACYVPARRAMRVDPITALRYE